MDIIGQVDDGGARVRAALQAALKHAMRARDGVAASVLRGALGAIGNAESVSVSVSVAVGPGVTAAPVGGPHFAGAVAGLGAGEVARRRLAAADVDAIVRAEIAERDHAAEEYQASGRPDQADRLRREAKVLADVINAVDQGSDDPHDQSKD